MVAPTMFPDDCSVIIASIPGYSDNTAKQMLDNYGFVEGEDYFIEDGVKLPGYDIPLNGVILLNFYGSITPFSKKIYVNDILLSDYILATDIITKDMNVYMPQINNSEITIDYTRSPYHDKNNYIVSLIIGYLYDPERKEFSPEIYPSIWYDAIEMTDMFSGSDLSCGATIDDIYYDYLISYTYDDGTIEKQYLLLDSSGNIQTQSTPLKLDETYHTISDESELEYVTVGLFIDNNSEGKLSSTFFKGVGLLDISMDPNYILNNEIYDIYYVQIFENYYITYYYYDEHSRYLILSNKEFLNDDFTIDDLIVDSSYQSSNHVLSDGEILYTAARHWNFKLIDENNIEQTYNFKEDYIIDEAWDEETESYIYEATFDRSFWEVFINDTRFNDDNLFEISEGPYIIDGDEYYDIVLYKDKYIVRDEDGYPCVYDSKFNQDTPYTIEEMPK